MDANWFVVLTAFSWLGALAATARDIVLSTCFFGLAIGSTIACCLFAYDGGNSSASADGLKGGVAKGIKAASEIWMLLALMA